MPTNERLRHAHPGAGMLTVAAPSGTGRHSAAVTDRGGGANMLRASSRRYGWLVSIPDAVDGTPEWQFWSQFAGSMLWLLSAP
jgi:hypothetical protein